jgi:hypothetical protein
MSGERTGSKRNRNAMVAEGIVKSVKSLEDRDTDATFSEILTDIASRGILSNHRSLRIYLDSLVRSGLLKERTEPARQPNVRPRQVYSLGRRGPFIEVGERALIYHGLNWTLHTTSSIKAKTDIEGVVRARLEAGTLYGSLEDTIVENLARVDRAKVGAVVPFCAALLATKKFEQRYLTRRATERGVGGSTRELLDEIEFLLTSPKPDVDDVKSLYAIRKWFDAVHRRGSARPPEPRWSLLSRDELVDVIGKQLGLK